MRLAILTSVDIRHRYVARALVKKFDVVAIGYEQTGYHPIDERIEALSLTEKELALSHFEERTRQEETYFGHDGAILQSSDGPAIEPIAPGGLNSESTHRFLARHDPDLVVVYGTNMIQDALLHRWRGKMINMHLGLSPYYRGTATNFFPLLNDELEYIGATIHTIDAGIDSGAIYAHARPSICADDMPHTIGCKAILSGLDALIFVLSEWGHDTMTPVPQWDQPGAKLYLRKHYHPRQVAQLYKMIEGGLIARYAARAGKKNCRIRLIEPWHAVPSKEAVSGS